ncbi:hypothetical protein [Halobacillus sp. BBL2006]|uniref:hypothetical protein n=1 Tax=Halobacillus sp. BBL2006 TaxID=1543706 RepID=UPI0005436891|nr:hypothetical protein [Halobacillus sp. BBL2006]KHE67284.1 hypothetical protein LD39_18335 [Halobacillus sp. BBL2006]
MIYAIITLIGTSIMLFLLSFFMKDRIKDVEDQIEQISLTMLQQNYQIKHKMKVLEEELLTDNLTEEIMERPYKKPSQTKPPSSVSTVQSMFEKGYKTHYIAKQINMTEHEVQSLRNRWNEEERVR